MQQRIRVLGNAVSNRQIGLLELDVLGRLDHHVGQLVSRIVAVFIDAAAAGLDSDAVAGRVLRGDLVLEQAHFRDLDPQAVQQLLCIVVRQDARFLIRLVVGIQVLVQTAQIVRGCVLLHEAGVFVGKDGLAGLIEAARRMLRYPAADLCDLEQLCLALLVRALRRHLFGEVCMAVCQMDDRVRCQDLRLVEEGFLQIARHRIVQRRQLLFRFLLECAQALAQDHAPAHRGLAIAADCLTVDKNRAVCAQAAHIFGQHQVPAVQYTLVLPVVLDLIEVDLLTLIAQVERVERAVRNGVHLLLDDACGAVRVQDAAARLEAYAANQQLVILDVDLLLFAGAGITRRLLDDPRLAFGFLKALRDILCVVHVHVYPRAQVLLPQRFDAFLTEALVFAT